MPRWTSKFARTVSLQTRLAAHSFGFPFKFGFAKLHAPISLEHIKFVKGWPSETVLPVVRVQLYLSSPLSVKWVAIDAMAEQAPPRQVIKTAMI